MSVRYQMIEFYPDGSKLEWESPNRTIWDHFFDAKRLVDDGALKAVMLYKWTTSPVEGWLKIDEYPNERGW